MISKETKNIHGLLLFFGIHESSISILNLFTPKIIGRILDLQKEMSNKQKH